MTHEILDAVLRRAESAKSESDFAYFFSVLLAGEALFKTTVLGYLSALTEDSDRNRYRLEHSLIRADGLGDWGRVLEDALTGPASQYLLTAARDEQAELTRLCKAGDWQYEAVSVLKEALQELGIESEDVPVKSDLKRWFRLFVTLRNKTRGHGATLPSRATKAAEFLRRSVDLICHNHSLFKRSWVYLNRNLSGKYRVSRITEDYSPFDFLTRESTHSLPNGIYAFIGAPRLIPLLKSDPELQDFFFANGGLKAKSYELLSYVTDNKTEGDASQYNTPPGTLPPSETEGHGELEVKGKCLSNAPNVIPDYVPRTQLETKLQDLLLDDRRPIVTLIGRGGIGKTSLALQVVPRLYATSRYDVVVWFSARDIDLQPTGPKAVRPTVLSPNDISQYYASLVLSEEQRRTKGFNARQYFEQQLQKSENGPCLFVFDNFETTQSPVEVFNWIDTFIRLPNKALITTRLRDFKGDYPLEVGGMAGEEAKLLIDRTAARFGINQLLTPSYVRDIIAESGGHPYVIKVLLGEVANSREIANVRRILAGSDEILVALFERTYASLAPCAQRAFLTLSAWNSSVPRIALEAVMLRSIPERSEIEKGIDSLIQFSMVESHIASTDKQEFISLPVVSAAFGQKKLNISPFKAAIQADVEVLQMLGPSRRDDIHLGLARKFETFVARVSRRIDGGESIDRYLPIMEMICRAYVPAWLSLAKLHMESGEKNSLDSAKEAIRRLLEVDALSTTAVEAWRLLADVCIRSGDTLGEIHALIERAQIGAVHFSDLSNTANRLNAILKLHALQVDQEQKRALGQRIADVMERRRTEADADDLSRMAWLRIRLGQTEKAREYVKMGLRKDPDNDHCRNLAQYLADTTK